MSRLAGPSWRSILYCNPEQPPPTTATRSTPAGRPCLVSRVVTLVAAFGVNLSSRSSPVRKAGAAAGLLEAFAIIEGNIRAWDTGLKFKLRRPTGKGTIDRENTRISEGQRNLRLARSFLRFPCLK